MRIATAVELQTLPETSKEKKTARTMLGMKDTFSGKRRLFYSIAGRGGGGVSVIWQNASSGSLAGASFVAGAEKWSCFLVGAAMQNAVHF